RRHGRPPLGHEWTALHQSSVLPPVADKRIPVGATGRFLRAAGTQRAELTRHSPYYTDDPSVESDLPVQPRPRQIAIVPAARIPDIDAISVVSNPDKPMALTEPLVATHE